MADVLDPRLVRNGTYGSVWLDGEQVCESYALQFKLNKNKEPVPRCRTLAEGKKMTSYNITGTIRMHNATSRLITLETRALKEGRDAAHTIISLLDDPDNPQAQRVAITGVSFDDLTLADWEAAKLGSIEAPFTAEDFEILEA